METSCQPAAVGTHCISVSPAQILENRCFSIRVLQTHSYADFLELAPAQTSELMMTRDANLFIIFLEVIFIFYRTCACKNVAADDGERRENFQLLCMRQVLLFLTLCALM